MRGPASAKPAERVDYWVHAGRQRRMIELAPELELKTSGTTLQTASTSSLIS
jgi:hypothetical protein